MKKINYLILLLIGLFSLTNCSKKTYIVVFDTNGGGIIESQNVTKGQKVTRPDDPYKDGYTFVDWFTSREYNEKYDFNNPVKNTITLYAKYEENIYTINYTIDDVTMSKTFKDKNSVIIDEPTKLGHKFIGWYENNEKITSFEERNYNLVAKWERTHYVINFEIGNQKVTKLIELGDKVLKPNDPIVDGKIFIDWYLDEEVFDFNSNITGDLTIIAKFEVIKYNVKFISNSDEEVPTQVVEHGKLASKPILKKEGYEFKYWEYLIDEFDFNEPIIKDLVLVAKWEMTDETVKKFLESVVPEVAKDNLNFISRIANCSAEFIWTTSNEEAITSEGNIRHLWYDAEVDINVEVVYDDHSYNLKLHTIVEKINLKPLVKGSIVSGYLYGSNGFNELSDSALSQVDYINFSFAEIVNGEIALPDDKILEKILKYREKGVRIGIAIGGWGAGGFSEAMATPAKRTKLINSIMKAIKEYQFDGIDIDWEYPTSSVAGITSSPQDKANLNEFAKEMRSRMDEYREDLVLSIAIAPNIKFFDLPELNKYMDFFNVMTYDFSMGTKASHDSNLYSNSVASSSMDNSVKYVQNYVDSDKIIPGAAFYARYGSFASEANAFLGGTLSIAMSKALSFDKMYQKILDENLTELYDETAEAAYIIDGLEYYSYDNPRSIKAKCEYVKNKGLAGLMCWDLNQDYVSSDNVHMLLNAMYENLK